MYQYASHDRDQRLGEAWGPAPSKTIISRGLLRTGAMVRKGLKEGKWFNEWRIRFKRERSRTVLQGPCHTQYTVYTVSKLYV